MRKYVIMSILMLFFFGMAPYVYSLFSYRGTSGYIGEVNGVQYDYVYADRTHYHTPRIFIYPRGIADIEWQGLSISINDIPLEFDEGEMLIMKADGNIVALDWDNDFFAISTDFNSVIGGIFGPVPHFKSHNIENPDCEKFIHKIKEVTHNNTFQNAEPASGGLR